MNKPGSIIFLVLVIFSCSSPKLEKNIVTLPNGKEVDLDSYAEIFHKKAGDLCAAEKIEDPADVITVTLNETQVCENYGKLNEIYRYKNLVHFGLHNTMNIEQIDFTKFSELRFVYFRRPITQKTLDNVLRCPKLIAIHIMGEFDSIPSYINKLKLKRLELSDVHVKKIPESIKNLEVELLSLKGGNYPNHYMFKVKGLKKLGLIGYPGDSIPRDLVNIQSLKWLYIADNFVALPSNFNKLDSLEYFYLHKCDNTTSLPNMEGMKNLKEVSITWTKLEEFPNVKGCNKLKKLVLHAGTNCWKHSNGIDSIPDWLTEMKSIEYLQIQGHPLTYVSDSICRLTKLKHLNLQDTPTEFKKNFPECIMNIDSLNPGIFSPKIGEIFKNQQVRKIY